MKLIGLIKKAWRKLFRKKTREVLWGQKFDGTITLSRGLR